MTIVNPISGNPVKTRAKRYPKRNRYKSTLSHRPKSAKGMSMKIWWRVKYEVPSSEYTLLYKTMFDSVENVLYSMKQNKEDVLSVTKTGYLWMDILSGVSFYNQLVKLLPSEKFEIGFYTY